MRAFAVRSNAGKTVALVFHDYLSQVYYCRTRSESFRRAFDAVSVKSRVKLSKSGRNVKISEYGPGDYKWSENMLWTLCGTSFTFQEVEDKSNPDTLVDSFLCD